MMGYQVVQQFMDQQAKPLRMGIFFREARRSFDDLSHLPKIDIQSLPHDSSPNTPISLTFPWTNVILYFLLMLQVTTFPLILSILYTNLSNPDVLIWCIPLVSASGICKVFIRTQMLWMLYQLETRVRQDLCKRIVSHSLFSSGLHDKTNTWNLVNNETNTAINYFVSKQDLIGQSVKLLFGVSYLYYTFSTAIFYGIALVTSVLWLISFASGKITKLWDDLAVIRDSKFGLISLMLGRIREIKMCRLENYFFKKLSAVRGEEFDNLKQRKLFDSICVGAWQLSHIVLSFSVFVIYLSWYGEAKFEVESVLHTLEMLIIPLNSLPWYLSGLMKSRQALKRINQFLQKHPKLECKHVTYNPQLSGGLTITKPGSVSLINLEVDKFTLEKGKVYCLQGASGSGKSVFMKSLLGMFPSEYECTIDGKVGYVDESLFHLENSLGSIYTTLKIEPNLYNQQLQDLLLKFHCLEIPLDNETSTYSGGEKLRLALVRAFHSKDVILVDSDLNSLDKKVRKYIESQLITLAHDGNKIVIIATNAPVSPHRLKISNHHVSLTHEAQPDHDLSAPQERESYTQSYYKQHNKQLSEVFQLKPSQPLEVSNRVSLRHYLFYFKNFFHHGVFVFWILVLFFLKNYYKYYINNYVSEKDFILNLSVIAVAYLVAVVFRAYYFAEANLIEAKRVGMEVLKTLSFANIEFYEDSGKENLLCRATSDMETVDHLLPHEMNILSNNLFEMMFKLGMMVWYFPYLLVPVMMFLVDFSGEFFRYRRISLYLEANSNRVTEKLLQSVNAVSDGKTLIKGMKREQQFFNEYQQRLDDWTNNRTCVVVQDRQFSQRFHIFTQALMLLSLLGIYFFRDKISSGDIQIKLALSYMIAVTNYFGFFSKSVVTNENLSRTIKRQSECVNKVNHLNQSRMTEETKQAIKQGKLVKSLDIQKLNFKYETSKESILNNLDIQLKEEEKILIRGKTGSGKTTFFKVLTGLYPEVSPIGKYFESTFLSFSPQKPLILLGDLRQNLDPYQIFSEEEMEPYLKRFRTRELSQLTQTEQLALNTTRAQVYGKDGVTIYDEPSEVASQGTQIIVSHHGEFQVDRQYQLLEGKLAKI